MASLTVVGRVLRPRCLTFPLSRYYSCLGLRQTYTTPPRVSAVSSSSFLLPLSSNHGLRSGDQWFRPITNGHSATQMSSCWNLSPNAPSDVDAGNTNQAPTSLSSSSSSSSAALDVYDTESIVYTSWEKHTDVVIDAAVVQDSPAPGDRVTVTWQDGESPASYPVVWLRDNCRCQSCFNASAKSRMISMADLDLNCSIRELSIGTDKKYITIVWSDNHVSQYPARWLRCNTFSATEPDPVRDIRPELWDASSFPSRMRHFEFEDVLTDDVTLYELLREIKLVGLAIMTNAPLQQGQLHSLGSRIGYLWPSHYGITSHIMSRADPSNVAYTTGDFKIHTDFPYFQRPAATTLLHCIEQAVGEGGENTFVDGFRLAEDLRKLKPELFGVLTRLVIENYDCGFDTVGEFYQHGRHNVIGLDDDGRVNNIVYGDHGRSALCRIDVDEVGTMYNALKAFASLLHNPAYEFRYKMKEGDIVFMDNTRLLHGRKSYIPTPGTTRYIEVGHFNWDTLHSKLRVLTKSL